MIRHLHVPVTAPEDVVWHLGKQERHWKEGRSAQALATLWFQCNGFPPAVRQAFETLPRFRSAQLVDAFFERQVDLRSSGRPSQTDLLVIAALDDGLAIVGVEGKAGEPFGDHVKDWDDGGEGKRARLDSLCTLLGLRAQDCANLRYQLLHRTASVLLEAERYRSADAVLLIHSFDGDADSFDDYRTFLEALGFEDIRKGTMTEPVNCAGIRLYAVWVDDEAPIGAKPGDYLLSLRAYAERLAGNCKRVRDWCDSQLRTSSTATED